HIVEHRLVDTRERPVASIGFVARVAEEFEMAGIGAERRIGTANALRRMLTGCLRGRHGLVNMPLYEIHDTPHVDVGHALVDSLPSLGEGREDLRERYGQPAVVGLLVRLAGRDHPRPAAITPEGRLVDHIDEPSRITAVDNEKDLSMFGPLRLGPDQPLVHCGGYALAIRADHVEVTRVVVESSFHPRGMAQQMNQDEGGVVRVAKRMVDPLPDGRRRGWLLTRRSCELVLKAVTQDGSQRSRMWLR